MADAGPGVAGSLDHHVEVLARQQSLGVVAHIGRARGGRGVERGGGVTFRRPAGLRQRRARVLGVQVGDGEQVHPGGAARLGQEHGAELAGPDEADAQGPALLGPPHELTMEVHAPACSLIPRRY